VAEDHISCALTAHPAGAQARDEDSPEQERGHCAGPDDGAAGSKPARPVDGWAVTGSHGDRSYRYRIRVRGRLGETIRSAFPALQAKASGGDTVLTGPLADRAALYGVLAQIEELGLELLEVRRLPPV